MNLVISPIVSFVFAVTAFSITDCINNASDPQDNIKPHIVTFKEQYKQTDYSDYFQNRNSTRDKRGFVYVPERAQPPTWGRKMYNRFKKRTSSILGSAGLAHGSGTHLHGLNDNDYEGITVADTASVVDDNEASGAFWNLYSSGGHGGGGHGGGYGSGYGKGVNKSAVGLLGFLSLLSLIQMSLATTTAAPAPATTARVRARREISGSSGERTDTSPGSDTDRIMKIVLPLMTAVTSSTRNERANGVKECILFQMCEANAKLAVEFGDQGTSLGLMISDALGKMLKEVGKGELSSKFRYAGMAGRNGKACKKLYKSCQEIS